MLIKLPSLDEKCEDGYMFRNAIGITNHRRYRNQHQRLKTKTENTQKWY